MKLSKEIDSLVQINRGRLALDIGNVLIRANLDCFSKKLADIKEISEKESIALMDLMQKMTDIGLMNMRQALSSMCGIEGYNQEVLIRLWNKSVIKRVKILEQFLDKLISGGMHVALLSNIGFDHADFIRDIDVFNKCQQHFSCEVGARKPSKLFFQSFISAHSDYCYCPFLDDRIENVKAAEKFLTPRLFDISNLTDKEALKLFKEKIKRY